MSTAPAAVAAEPQVQVNLTRYEPKQQHAHELLWTEVDELLFGGAQGGGKTHFGTVFWSQYAIACPGAKIGVFRRNKDDLIRELVPRFLRLLRGYPRFRYLVGDSVLQFDNGDGYDAPTTSMLHLLHCETEQDADSYQTEEFTGGIWLEEASQFSRSMRTKLSTRARSGSSGFPTKRLFTSNPDGIGNDWLVDDFVNHDPSGRGEVITHTTQHTGADGRTRTGVVRRAFLQSFYTDNSHVANDPEFLFTLSQLDEDLLAARRDGNFMRPSGQFFRTWNRARHVIEPFPIPAHWPCWRSIDFGDQYRCHWWAQHPDTGRLYVWQELAAGRGQPYAEITDPEAKRLIVAMTAGRLIDYTVADVSAKVKQRQTATALSTWEVYAKPPNAVPLTEPNKRRVDGWRVVKSALRLLSDGLPALQIFENCPDLIRTLPRLIYHDRKPGDIADGQDDHSADSLRYGLMSRLNLTPALVDPKEEAEPQPAREARLAAAEQRHRRSRKWNSLVGAGR